MVPYPKNPPAGVIDIVTTFSDWGRKFAWLPTHVTKESTIFFRWYYERTCCEFIRVDGERSELPISRTIQRAGNLFDILTRHD